MKIDFHCHVLPAFDDGAANINESLDILEMQKQQGFTHVVSTSHFYRQNETAEEFVKRRDFAYQNLIDATKGKNLPTTIKGAEILFYNSIIDDNLDDLCIEGTDYLLLELPFNGFTKTNLRYLTDFVEGSPYKIIFAHIERYYDMLDKDLFNALLSLNALYQINCSSLVHKKRSKITLNLIKAGYIHIIGTDAHNMSTRPPLYLDAAKVIERKIGKNALVNLHQNGQDVLRNMSVEDFKPI